MNNRRQITQRSGLVLLGAIALSVIGIANCTNAAPNGTAIAAKEDNKESLNVLFILADDQKWNGIGALGNDEVKTPNLDKLVDRSFLFNNAYCFGGNVGAVCISARNMVMSGKVFFRFEEDEREMKSQGKKRPNGRYTNPDWVSFPKAMKAAGYEAYFHEKSGWANNPDVRFHFDHHASIDMPKALSTGRAAKGIVDDAILFMEQGRDTSKPFFMYLGLPCPHDPRWSSQRFRDMYNPDSLSVPPNFLPFHPFDNGDLVIRDEALNGWPRTEADIRKHTHDYYALMSSMDFDLGRLFDKLNELGLDENTIIVYSSDQGLAMGSHGLLGKQNIYESTMKVPLLVSGPGIEPGRSDAFAYIHDIYPTVCDMVGASVPQDLDGKSLVPVIQGEIGEVRDTVMLSYMRDYTSNKVGYQRSVRAGDWKLIRYPKVDQTQLFNLLDDPLECNDLSVVPGNEAKVAELMTLLESAQTHYGDIRPLVVHESELMPVEYKFPNKQGPKPRSGGLAPNDIERTP